MRATNKDIAMIELIEDDGVIATPLGDTILWTTRQLQFEVTKGAEIKPAPLTGPIGLTRTSFDGERLGRMGWTPPGGI